MCNFKELEDNLKRDRIVLGVLSKATRKRLLVADKLTNKLCILVHICRGDERMESQMTSLSPANTPPNDMHGVTSRSATTNQRCQANNVRASGVITCKYCGRDHARKKEKCPAWGEQSSKCGRSNHFTKMCQSKNTRRVLTVNNQSEDSDTASDTTLDDRNPHFVAIVQEHGRPVHVVDLTIDNICIAFIIKRKRIVFHVDSGASVNLISAMGSNSTVTPIGYISVCNEVCCKLIDNQESLRMY